MEKKEDLYLAPEVSVIEIATETVVCTSDPGDIPGDLESGEWI